MEKFSEIQYVRPDFPKLKKELLRLTKELKKAPDYETFREKFQETEQVVIDQFDAETIVEIRNSINKADKFYDEEVKYLNKAGATLQMPMLGFYKTLVKSPFRKQFDEEFGDFLTKKIEHTLKLISVFTLADGIKESELVNQYSKDAASCVTDFRGESCNFYGLLKHMESTDRTERKEAFEAWAKLYESVSAKLDATYDRLVRLRAGMAKKLGFKNYIDYIYIKRERFDYKPEDIAAFRNAVAKIIVPFCSELFEKQRQRIGVEKLHFYDEKLVFPEGNALPIGTKDELVEKARAMYHELSPETGEYFDFMCEHELFDLETRLNKHLGGFCTFLPKGKAPFIFSNFNGTSADVDVLTHEAGHAFECYTASRHQKTMLSVSSTSEINEIHSMSMETFAYPWMESFFGDKADKYRFAHLCDTITSIPYMTAVDEFQHRVFENPKAGPMERRKFWQEIEKIYLPWRDYDGNAFLEGGGFWMQKQHIFMHPFYYVDYALAQICAHQLFLRGRKDRGLAWHDYYELCKMGGSRGYFDLLKSASLKSPFEEETIREVIDGIREVISEFEKKA